MVANFQAALAQLRKEYYWDQLPIQPDVDEKGIEDAEQFEYVRQTPLYLWNLITCSAVE